MIKSIINTLKKQLSGKRIHEKVFTLEAASDLCRPGEICTTILNERPMFMHMGAIALGDILEAFTEACNEGKPFRMEVYYDPEAVSAEVYFFRKIKECCHDKRDN